MITVRPEHPIWKSFDDDDWNGTTAVQWLVSLKGQAVTLVPPVGCSTDTIERIRAAVARCADSVDVNPNLSSEPNNWDTLGAWLADEMIKELDKKSNKRLDVLHEIVTVMGQIERGERKA